MIEANLSQGIHQLVPLPTRTIFLETLPNQNLEKDLEQVQRRAASRFVFNEYQDVFPGCVSTLMERLRWEPLKDRRCKDRLTMAYKIHNRLVDIDPSNYYKPGDSRTRGGHRIHQQRRDGFRGGGRGPGPHFEKKIWFLFIS